MNYNQNRERFLQNEKQNQLNKKQFRCFNMIIAIINNNSQKNNFFV